MKRWAHASPGVRVRRRRTGGLVVYKPARTKQSGGAPPAPSWKVPTDPEPRWAAFAAILMIIVGQTWVGYSLSETSASDWLTPQVVWLFPVLSAALLVGSVLVYLPTHTEPSPWLRRISLGLLSLLVAADVTSLVVLVGDVFRGLKLNPLALLGVGVVLWLVNICVFALGYWEMDGGGPERRSDGYEDYPDLVFPQQQQDQQGLAPDDWKPNFADYLYVSLTAGTAFSPTDAMPYSRQAKLVMGCESTISIVIVAMLVARAINIAHG